ncbi:uncharacterized protein LOC105831336 isoform X3 [Monomorium pharaonis]|uniref:uncharacterized protein LOC105831336 isoform X3 n=1 Tax=Monomorium pharaonis TaxID=307658 RepID=UPI0017461766|nr:uncharacterized protein LOC105831336 isoform X3 [Monomorium pharaonis]
MSGLIQYVVVRGDLARTMGWPLGAVVAQACHACTAVTHLFYSDAHTQAYLADLDNMHKVVLEMQMQTESSRKNGGQSTEGGRKREREKERERLVIRIAKQSEHNAKKQETYVDAGDLPLRISHDITARCT